jgi:signal transduction histidine kinase/ligand-binding sensor domain-containing protein/DNA-binding response OmpR family regulator
MLGLALLLLSFSQISEAQIQQSFVKLDQSVGLPGGSITSITQGRDGFVWIGTKSGLTRYDGHDFRIYTQQTGGLSADDVSTLFVDSKDRLWIGTISGLNLYDARRDRFIQFHHHPSRPNSLSSDEINTIYEDVQKQLWVGTEKGLNQFIETDSSFARVEVPGAGAALSQYSVKSVYADQQQTLWVGTFGGGLFSYHSQTHRVRHQRPKANERYAAPSYIHVLAPLNETELLVGTSGEGLLRFHTQQGTFTPFFEKESAFGAISIIRALHQDPDGNIWVGTDGDGLLKISEPAGAHPAVTQFVKRNEVQPSLASNAVYAVFADQQANIWVGTAWNGISILERHDPAIRKYYSDFAGANLSPVLSIHQQDHTLWFGTDGQGLYILNQATSAVTRLTKQQLGGDYIQMIKPRRQGGFFLGTFGSGLLLYDPEKGLLAQYRHRMADPHSLPFDDVRDIVEEDNGNFWVATWGGGLSYFDAQTQRFTTYKKEAGNPRAISSDNIICLAPAGPGKLWVGTFGGGLNLLDTGTQTFSRVQAQQGSAQPTDNLKILSLLADSHGALWIGTWDQGLLRYDAQKQQFLFFSEWGLQQEKSITALVEDDEGNVWLSTKSGIYAYSYRTDSFKRYPQLNGEYHINAVFKDQGELFFGGNKGVVSFRPQDLKSTAYVPNIKFTGFKLFNKEVAIGENNILDTSILYAQEINLKHNHSLITLDFAALNFPFANHEYAIKLENFDEEWREIGPQRSATFTNLAPGSYTFKVKARIPGENWGDAFEAINLVVQKPFWKTWWAYLLYTVVAGALLYLFYRYTVYLETLKNKLRLEQLTHEKDQELNKLKLRFFTDVSHEIRTPVTLILGAINRIAEAESEQKQTAAVREIQKNGSHLLQLVNELLDFRKLEAEGTKLKATKGNFTEFVQEIFLSFSSHAEHLRIDYGFSAEADDLELWFDRVQMEKVVYNLLFNAFKYTEAGGSVQIHLKKEEAYVDLVVTDTGKGIPEDRLRKIFKRFYQVENEQEAKKDGFGIGLSIVKRIVKGHGGTICVESTYGQGSTFSVRLPRGEDHLQPHQKETAPLQDHLPENWGEAEALSPAEQLQAQAFAETTILLVEDNPDIRQYVRQLLEPYFQVMEAENGKEGLALALAETPDLILSDVMMPEMDGIALTRALKKDVRTSHIPVILLTARTSFIYQKEGLQIGADDYVTKPFHEVLLKTRIFNLLKSRQLLREKYQLEALMEPGQIASSFTSPDQKFINDLTRILDAHLDNPELQVEFITREIGISHSVVYKKIKSLTGLTLVEFIRDYRLKRAAHLLKNHDLSVVDVSYQVGFTDRRYFSQMFKKRFGKTPSEYAKEAVY